MELWGADRVMTLRDAPAPNPGTAHSVANLVSFLNSMMLNSNLFAVAGLGLRYHVTCLADRLGQPSRKLRQIALRSVMILGLHID